MAPVGRDAELIANQLERVSVGSILAANEREAIAIAGDGVAGVIITVEGLTSAGLAAWERLVRSQPPWSDLPFLLLGSFGADWAPLAQIDRVRQSLGNVTLLDRPLRARLLLSAVGSALRARKRQYEMRDTLIAQQEAEAALRQSEKLAVAGRMAATISHEINNPLSAVANLLYLGETKSNDPDARRYLAMAQDELRRVSEIVRETLRFHRAQTAPGHCDMRELLDSSINLFTHKMSRHGIRLVKNYEEGLIAYCSSGEIRQAVVNLVGNAIDAMPEGGTLRISAKKLSVGRRPGIMIFVADNGNGIPEGARSKLFEQFFTTKGSVGTGLGLWLTRDVVQRNHGKIHFRTCTKKQGGTVFSVWLPAADVESPPIATGDELNAA